MFTSEPSFSPTFLTACTYLYNNGSDLTSSFLDNYSHDVSPDNYETTDGYMFDIFAMKDILIFEIDVHIVDGVNDAIVEVYRTCCNVFSFDGVRRHPTAWILVGKSNLNSNGAGIPTTLSLSETVCIEAGFSRGFHITATNGRYLIQRPYGKTGDVYLSNEDMTTFVGIGKTYWLVPSFNDRAFVGVIRYKVREERNLLRGYRVSHSVPLSLCCEKWFILTGITVIIFFL